jgi:hypothetical protein
MGQPGHDRLARDRLAGALDDRLVVARLRLPIELLLMRPGGEPGGVEDGAISMTASSPVSVNRSPSRIAGPVTTTLVRKLGAASAAATAPVATAAMMRKNRVMARTFPSDQRKLLSELDIWSETWITFEFIS